MPPPYDEAWLQEALNKNPDLRRRNPSITDSTCNTTSTRLTVIQPDEQELQAKAAAMLEAELQSELRKKALAGKFLYYHTRDSRRSDKGFLDTVLLRVGVKVGELYFVECKTQEETLSEEQKVWVEILKAFRDRAFNFAGMNITVDVFVWRPMDLLTGVVDEILKPKEPIMSPEPRPTDFADGFNRAHDENAFQRGFDAGYQKGLEEGRQAGTSPVIEA